MKATENQITPERKAMYNVGTALGTIGLLLFLCSFLPGLSLMTNGWDQAEFEQAAKTSMVCALLGFGLVIIGSALSNIGALGTAGSGLVLDPEQARRDLEPWSRMAGGVLQDALSEVGAAKTPGDAPVTAAPQVKVRCPACRRLNDEAAKFCDRCGSAI
jgi:hypothetical protein